MFRKYLTGQYYEGEGNGSVTPPAPPSGDTAHPVAAPWGASIDNAWTIGEGEAAKPWWNAITEPDVRQHVEAKGYKNPAELAMANLNLTRMQRGAENVIALPGQDAKPEDWNAFYTKLGRPESADKYEFKFADGVQVDEGMVKFGKDVAFKYGLNPTQAQALADDWNKYVGEATTASTAAQQTANDAAMTALQTKWGADLEANRAAGERAMRALNLSPEAVGAIEKNIGSAAIVELLATIGRKSDEGGFVATGKGDPNNPVTMNAAQAQAKIDQLQGDTAFQEKYTKATHPEHKQAVELMLALTQRTFTT